MILKYTLSDNQLVKEDATMYPNNLQDNIKLEFAKTEELPNSKYYVDIKTTDAIKKVRLKKYNGTYTCDLPKWVTNYPFFKLKVHTFVDGNHFVTNELIVPVRCLDYLDYNRTIANNFPQPRDGSCYDDFDFKGKHKKHKYIYRPLNEADLEIVDDAYLKFLVQYRFSVDELAIIFNTDVKTIKDKLEEIGVDYNL